MFEWSINEQKDINCSYILWVRVTTECPLVIILNAFKRWII